ncbi:MAG: hypothetical protein PHX51_06870 [Clostridia bacterium]|nr:hypothetical protein [Clostridia bacterium]
MREKTKVILALTLLIGILLFALGLGKIIVNNQAYDVPVYISDNFTVTGYSTYTVQGSLTNRMSNDILIERIEVNLSGSDGRNHWSATWTKRDILIPANETIRLYESDLTYSFNATGYTAEGCLTDATVSDCIIDGVSYKLKYSENGQDFSRQGDDNGTSVLILVGGIILLLVSGGIIVYLFKTRNN